jgi:hypothetical protein
MVEYVPLFYWTLEAGLEAMWIVRSMATMNPKTDRLLFVLAMGNVQRKHFRDNK